jgi:hypothetical protein
MRERRHHGRLSSKFLPPQASLYNAMQAIIGAGLRERYDISEQLPSDLERLLKALKDAHSLAGPPEPSSFCIGNGAAPVITASLLGPSVAAPAASDVGGDAPGLVAGEQGEQTPT